MSKNKAKYLSKTEELELGRVIQDHYQAMESLESGEKLSKKDRVALNERVTVGKKAVDKLVRANIGLVHDRAGRFKTRFPSGPEYDDLVQEGMTGLLTAVRKYDPERGNKFSTVAYYWIAQAVARGANKTGRTVRLPENRINDFVKMNQIVKELESEYHTSGEIDEIIMDRLGLSKVDLMNIRAAASTPASLNKVVGREAGSNRELMDYVGEDSAEPSSEESVIASQMNDLLLEAVENLDPIKRDVILATFSLSEGEELSVEDVRTKYSLAPFKFKRVQVEAMRELREKFSREGLSFSDFVMMS